MIASQASHLPRVNSFIFIGASGVLAIVAAFNPGELLSIALCAALSVTLPASLLINRVRSRGMTDPVALFCLGFVAYNAALLARVAIVGGAQNLETPYPIQFDNSVFLHAGLLNVLSALCITFTEMMFPEAGQRSRILPLSASPKHFFWAGVAIYILGTIFYYLNMTALGGILAFYALDRGQRYSNLAGEITYPATACFTVGCILLFYATLTRRNRFGIVCAVVAIASWSLAMILEGDRRTLVGFAISCIALYACVRGQRIMPTVRVMAACSMAFIALMAFGTIRARIPSFFATNASFSEVALGSSEQATDLQYLFPEHNELGGPYLSVLYSVSHDADPIYGRSYVDSMIRLVPRFLYPGQRPELLSTRFSEEMHGLYYGNLSAAQGWGYSFIAEAYDNFGTLGVVLGSAAWTAVFIALGTLPTRFRSAPFVFSILLPQALNCNRNDFSAVLIESFYNLVILFSAIVLVAMIRPAPTRARHLEALQQDSFLGTFE